VKEEICRRMPRNFFSLAHFQRKRKSLVFFQSINFLWCQGWSRSTLGQLWTGKGCVDEPGPETRGAHQGQRVGDCRHGLTEPEPGWTAGPLGPQTCSIPDLSSLDLSRLDLSSLDFLRPDVLWGVLVSPFSPEVGKQTFLKICCLQILKFLGLFHSCKCASLLTANPHVLGLIPLL
jgi:hypothetical protein